MSGGGGGSWDSTPSWELRSYWQLMAIERWEDISLWDVATGWLSICRLVAQTELTGLWNKMEDDMKGREAHVRVVLGTSGRES